MSGEHQAPPPPIPGYYVYTTTPTAAHVYSDEPRLPGRVLGGWLQALCWATAGLMLVLAVSCIVTAVQFQTYWTGATARARDVAFDDWAAAEGFMGGVYGFACIGWLASIIVMMVWMHTAQRGSSRLWPDRRSWSPGWSVGGWFIPVANLVIPKLVLLEIERVASSVDPDGDLDPQWRTTRGSAIGWLFWFSVVVAVLLSVLASALQPAPAVRYTETEADFYVVAMVVFAVSSLLGGVGAMFGALHFRALGRTLTHAASRREAMAEGGGAWVLA